MSILQRTNDAIGAVAVNGAIPLGRVTRQLDCARCGGYTISPTDAFTDTINEAGSYAIEYTATLTGGGAGTVVVELQRDGEVLDTRTVTLGAAASVVVAFIYHIKVDGNCCNVTNTPTSISLVNTGVALTGGNGTFIIRSDKEVR